jgi:CubicO group peptidase (beta-lactamase class C family)
MRKIGFVLIIAALAVLPQAGLGNDKVKQIDALLAKYHNLRQFNGSVLVAEDGEVILKKGLGYANMEWQIPNTPETKFRIGSVTKQFTAILILKLVEEGKMTLEGKITDYIPEYPEKVGNQVTIHHLLTHTSGIPSYTGFPNFFADMSRDPSEPDEFLEVFWDKELEFEPGSEWRYNNSAYFLLGAIIERVSGKSYETLLHERILDPLGLENTGYDHWETLIEKRATGYSKTFEGYENAAYLDMSLPYSAGSMYSTVEDLFKWDQILYTDVLFDDPKYKEKMFTPFLNNYAYGWAIRETELGDGEKKIKVIEHGGGINGFSTGFKRMVDDRHVIAIMDNTAQNVGRIMNGIVNILYEYPPEEPKQSIADVMGKAIAMKSVDAAIKHYHELKSTNADAYNFQERELNNLGYHYLNKDMIKTAIAVFKLNVEAYPDASNPYDSLGEAYKKAGNKELAIKNYKKSVELNPRNENGKKMLAELGVEVDEELGKEITLEPEILQNYVGKFELQPGFVLTITLEEGRLMAQATGQPKFEVFADSETKFFLKVVPAQITFDFDESGAVAGLTLHQGGRDMPGKKIE